MFSKGNSQELFFLQRETNSKEIATYLFFMNMEIATNFEPVNSG